MQQDFQRQPQDTVTVHPQVLRSLIRNAALEVPGVLRLGVSSSFDRWLGWSVTEDSIRLAIQDDEIRVSVLLIVNASHDLFALSQAVQQRVRRTLEDYVGLSVKAVNITIEDVVFGAEVP